MTGNELRDKFLKFYESQGHAIIPSAPLIPDNDPTTLFTGSGMQPLIPYLLGESHPNGVRLVNSQKSFRSVDIAEVGDNRHTTFFEMLGNWSLGDYFKEEQIPWVFEFLTRELGLDASRIYITCFAGNKAIGVGKDEIAADLWAKIFEKEGIDNDIADFTKGESYKRITYYEDKKNWWSRSGVPANMPEGEPGGPDSEMFWDFGAEHKLHEASEWKESPCHPNCDCGRFLEIGNNVFMQYVKKDGKFVELEQKNVDFGGGLERMLAAVNDNPDVFLIESFSELISLIEKESRKTYGENEEETKAFRVVLDHVRAATMLVADNVLPSNKDQGYFVRRLIRRAIRFADTLGVRQAFMERAVEIVISVYENHYPEVKGSSEQIIKAITSEEAKFRKTLKSGLKEFEKRFKKSGEITGEDAFVLYSTYGFPRELTEELANAEGQQIDAEAFEREFARHQATSREGSAGKFAGGLADSSEASTKYHTATHLLHQALRMVLGEHVEQRGSNITAQRMRFDFTHDEKLTDEEKSKVEAIVNEQIEKNLSVGFTEMSVDAAREAGALGVFGDKYGDTVKVYSVGDFSKEICGGPHVERTGTIGHFKITKEEASSAGVRRIKAIVE